LAAVALSVVASGCGGAGPPEPGNSATASPSAVVVDLDEADRLYYEGAFEEALAIYTQGADQGDELTRRRARWTLARTRYDRGDNGAAERAAEGFLELALTAEERRVALLLISTTEAAQGKNNEAAEHLIEYRQSAGAAEPYAVLLLADLAARRGDHAEAAALSLEALASPLPDSVAADARLALGGYQEEAGDIDAALATYDAVASDAPFTTDKAEALWRAGDLAYREGDFARALQKLQSLIALYPRTGRALEAIGHPGLSAADVRDRALTFFYHRVNAEAATDFVAILANPVLGDVAEAHYHLGILSERADDYDNALAHYDAAVAELADGHDDGLLGQSLWDRATVVERLGSTADAAEAYATVGERAPASERAAEALFRSGLLYYQLGDAAVALDVWGWVAGGSIGDAEAQARALFWMARAAGDLSKPETASVYLGEAHTADPLDYYAMRVRARFNGVSTFPDTAVPRSTAPNWAAIERWLRDEVGLEDIVARDALLEGVDWRRATELLRAGLTDKAETEFRALTDESTGAPWLLYRIARGLHEEGQAQMAVFAGSRLTFAFAEPPPALVRLAYPAEYIDLASEQAEEYGIPPLLLLALVRQESLYDADAVSSADAMGLTQVIPSTAAQIASELGEVDFTNADLFRPRTSLRFGAYYLASQLDLFDGDIWAALAAYNGGPGNALRWDRTAGGDADTFLEIIDLSETRAYVELVLEHYALYLYAYGLAEQPLLPLD